MNQQKCSWEVHLLTYLNRARRPLHLRPRLLSAEAGVVKDEHGLEDGRVGGAPWHARVADDLLEGHVSIGQRSLDDLLNAAEQRLEAGAACSAHSTQFMHGTQCKAQASCSQCIQP